ncbi:16S rRNA (cytosine(1402)-N(4))-methyltransferase RsmH [Pantoea sp. Mhis]|uniref:16S rRNA (cytosine(1402)-N(4))-methyltransferase RsmH n=1 Tax=Pantoea sp. Mhis TaxID=2576759 RepID=UPI00135A500E|nr:16S rRNA (cytosine(1402)-N(4))-methyltransferase RsmH [Pantoea sp. Mhis]MXP56488.1 16S rRNA (cytosine(1402)-N(4))-methyltransferase RsmH [Pantoea sp. Mhis]
MEKIYKHITVLLHEAVNGLNIKKSGIYIDATFGNGGHSRLILSKLGINGHLIAIDRDPQAVANANINDSRFSIIHGPFSALINYVSQRGLINKIDGILLDLGVSSTQLEDPKRGFSFMYNGLLDMRMDPTCGQSAAKWLLNAKEKEIIFVLKKYGEERFAKRIAHAIELRKRKKPITTTRELAILISQVVPIKFTHKHPATRSFQAIRILINNELEEINNALKGTLAVLALDGRLSVITFHSLEDRIVKHFMQDNSRLPQITNGIPITEDQLKKLNFRQLKILDRIFPSMSEIKNNPRARSSILRIAKRVR